MRAAAVALAAALAGSVLLPAGCSCGIGWGGMWCAPDLPRRAERPAPWVLAPTLEDRARFCRTDRSECRTLDAAMRREIDARDRP